MKTHVGTMGLLVFMFVILIAVQGIVLVVISVQNLDLKSFFVTFNQTAVENRRQNNISSEFRELQLLNIQEQQNRTQDLLPALFRQFNQTDTIYDLIQNNSEILAQLRFMEKEMRDNQVQIAYDQDRIRNLTEILIRLVNNTEV